jgi:hypothetical protein
MSYSFDKEKSLNVIAMYKRYKSNPSNDNRDLFIKAMRDNHYSEAQIERQLAHALEVITRLHFNNK